MKIKKSGKFFKSLRFRILIILIILGIVPSVIVTEMVIANYEDRAIANRVQSMENICDIMCDLLIKEISGLLRIPMAWMREKLWYPRK